MERARGFEPLVPRERDRYFEAALIDLRPLPPREPSFLARKTSSSKAASFSGESANHRFLGESEPTQTREKHRLRGSAGEFDRRVYARCQRWTRGCPGDGGLRHIFSALRVQRGKGCTPRSRPGFVTGDTGGCSHGPEPSIEATMGPVGVREGTAVPGASGPVCLAGLQQEYPGRQKKSFDVHISVSMPAAGRGILAPDC